MFCVFLLVILVFLILVLSFQLRSVGMATHELLPVPVPPTTKMCPSISSGLIMYLLNCLPKTTPRRSWLVTSMFAGGCFALKSAWSASFLMFLCGFKIPANIDEKAEKSAERTLCTTLMNICNAPSVKPPNPSPIIIKNAVFKMIYKLLQGKYLTNFAFVI